MFVSLRLFSLPSLFFFFTDTAPTEIYTLSLHDALPICDCGTPAPPARRERGGGAPPCRALRAPRATCWRGRDRKSTRLNSSHRCISYAVFCLKKKRQEIAKPQKCAPYRNRRPR